MTAGPFWLRRYCGLIAPSAVGTVNATLLGMNSKKRGKCSAFLVTLDQKKHHGMIPWWLALGAIFLDVPTCVYATDVLPRR